MTRFSAFYVFPFAAVLAGCGGSSPAAPTPTPTPTPAPAPTPTPQAPVVRVADLRGVNGHFTQGTARLIPSGGTHRLELAEDFATNGSSTIDIYLTRRADGPNEGDLNAGRLMSRRGLHSFDLGTADVSGYTHVLVWCRPFQIPIGLGELKAAP